MEKLIELLNEYGKGYFELDDEGGIVDSNQDTFEVTSYYITMQIISKRFGFIERLVENDKINVDEVNCQKIPYYSYLDEEGYVSFKSFGFYEQLLMLLTISDTPIEDLISYLKE